MSVVLIGGPRPLQAQILDDGSEWSDDSANGFDRDPGSDKPQPSLKEVLAEVTTDAPTQPSPSNQVAAAQKRPPLNIKLQADRQSFDVRRNLFIAEGNVRAVLNGGVLQADRIEFDSAFSTLYARGSVRFRRGSQYFQASTLHFSLIQNEGELSDVYGVLDLDSAALDFNPTSGSASSGPITSSPPPLLPVVESSSLGFPTALELELQANSPERLNPQDDGSTFWDLELPPAPEWLVPETAAPQKPELGMACPPVLPPIPAWQPHPWAVTAWGGQMIDSNFGDTFLFNGRMRPEYLLGVSMQKRIWRAGPFSLELEADLFGHHAYEQAGGPYNQAVPNADTASQTFAEGILGLGARLWIQPWLSFGFVEGISYNSAVSNYERTYRENYAQLLNYLAFELEAAVSDEVSLVGRIHHRSGAFGTYSGVREGSNAYLIGLRYRWGQDPAAPEQTDVPPPLGCPDPDRASRVEPQTLNEQLNDITLGAPTPTSTGVEAAGSQASTPLAHTNESRLSLREQEALRDKAIAAIDQRITSIQFQQSLTIDRRIGVPSSLRNNDVEEQNTYGAVQPSQLDQLGRTQLITGAISRWRIQAARVRITPDGWRADRMGFTNDPFTPAQTRIDADGVVATEQANGDILIKSERNRLIVEERLPIPVSRTQRIQKEEEVENRWVFGIDNEDRNGFFIGRNLKPIELTTDYTLSLQPQFLLQRAINGETNSYVAPGSSVDSGTVTQPTTIGDLFGLEAKLNGQVWGWKTNFNADISTFSAENIANGSRYWGDVRNRFTLPWLGGISTRLFGAYRYRTWNGSLGETDVYSAYGAFAEQKGNFNLGKLENSYLWRAGVGNYQAESFTSTNLADLWRANIFGSINSSYPLWRGQPAPLTPERAYRYSPVAIVPGLSLNTNVNTLLAAYGDGNQQNTISLSGGPTLTLGTFSKPFLDYTQLSVTGGGTLKQGASPFDFDQAVDLGTLGVGLTQQIAGPLLISAGVALNVDPASEFYGDVINSNIEVRWQRRSYDFGFYYNPYEGIGGFRFRLNDFNFTGTGVPFIPYTPRNLPNELENRPF
ncbi:hypothetical protein SynWH8101_0341 [Synechococcus sp. WH 8101]|nr:hypothetical protein SynWH8101_0341 [Synechococcus sp. WH 8101]